MVGGLVPENLQAGGGLERGDRLVFVEGVGVEMSITGMRADDQENRNVGRLFSRVNHLEAAGWLHQQAIGRTVAELEEQRRLTPDPDHGVTRGDPVRNGLAHLVGQSGYRGPWCDGGNASSEEPGGDGQQKQDQAGGGCHR